MLRYKLALIISLLMNITLVAYCLVNSVRKEQTFKVNLLETRITTLEYMYNYLSQENKLGMYERDSIVNAMGSLVDTLKATGVFLKPLGEREEIPMVRCEYPKNSMKKRKKVRRMKNENKMIWIGGER